MVNERIRRMVDAYMECEPSGGPLHVVLDDINMKRADVEFGRGEAVKQSDIFAMAICDALLSLSDVDRCDTIDPNGVYHIMGSTVEA